jgi:transposase-like protein
MTLSVPRDRAGTFDRKLIAKYQRRFPDFDEKIISMFAHATSTPLPDRSRIAHPITAPPP